MDLPGNYFSDIVIVVFRIRPMRMRDLCRDIPLFLNLIGSYSMLKLQLALSRASAFGPKEISAAKALSRESNPL